MKPLHRCALVLAAALCACQTQRILRVTSDPSQSEVRLDGQPAGTTPCDIVFEHYGLRRVTVYRQGYRTYSRVVELAPPWYGRFPFDILSEVLLPVGRREIHEVHVPLIAGVSVLLEPDLTGVLDRAEQLRRARPEGPRPAASGGVPQP